MSQPTPSPTYTLPTIHLNGTDAKTLADEYLYFYRALAMAVGALECATCNARDFYPQGPGAYEAARAERDHALQQLASLQDYALAWIKTTSGHL